MKLKILSTIVVLAIAVVIAFNATLEQEKNVSILVLANIEALAQGENGNSFGTEHYGCAIDEKYICGEKSDGSPIFCRRVVPGQEGICTAPDGSCSPYSCTRY